MIVTYVLLLINECLNQESECTINEKGIYDLDAFKTCINSLEV